MGVVEMPSGLGDCYCAALFLSKKIFFDEARLCYSTIKFIKMAAAEGEGGPLRGEATLIENLLSENISSPFNLTLSIQLKN